MAKHTRGDWRAFKEKREKLWRVSIDPGPTICRVAIQHGAVDEDKANAYLLAAAANLLTACTAALPHVEGMAISDAGDDERNPICVAAEKACEMIRAAIAKAEGRSF